MRFPLHVAKLPALDPLGVRNAASILRLHPFGRIRWHRDERLTHLNCGQLRSSFDRSVSLICRIDLAGKHELLVVRRGQDQSSQPARRGRARSPGSRNRPSRAAWPAWPSAFLSPSTPALPAKSPIASSRLSDSRRFELLRPVHHRAHQVLLHGCLESPVPQPVVGQGADHQDRHHGRRQAARCRVNQPQLRSEAGENVRNHSRNGRITTSNIPVSLSSETWSRKLTK